MRTAFIQQLMIEARRDERVFLIVGDLGYSVVEPFAAEFPDRFLNAGVAEQNMTGMAAGLASEGMVVFTYSIANFPTLRCLEQIRNDVCAHRLAVAAVAVGAGFAYGNLGYSHHAVQDIACLRGMPGLEIYSPADPGETRACLAHFMANPGPAYFRIGKAGEPELRPESPLEPGIIRVSGEPDAETAVVATGSILREAMTAAEEREDTAVYSVPLVTARAASLDPLWRHQHLITVEEHVRSGGLGERIAGLRPRGVGLTILCARDDSVKIVGSQQMLRRANGIDAAGIRHAMECCHEAGTAASLAR